MRDILPEIISIIVILSLFAASSIGGSIDASIKYDEKLWNDGHCDCGGTWKYEQAVGHMSSTSYIYVCEDCGKRIELHEVR